MKLILEGTPEKIKQLHRELVNKAKNMNVKLTLEEDRPIKKMRKTKHKEEY